MSDVKEKLDYAKVQLLLKHPFFGALLLRREMDVFTPPSPWGESACVDLAGRIHVSTKFVEAHTGSELVFVLAHELMHVIYAHLARMKGREPLLWNIACDAVINDLLIEEGVGSFPKGGVRIEGAENKSAEEIYDWLAQYGVQRDKAHQFCILVPGSAASMGGQAAGQGLNGQAAEQGDDKRDASWDSRYQDLLPELAANATPAQLADSILEARIALASALQAAKSIGRGSALCARLGKIIASTVPWYQRLEQFMYAKAGIHHSWNRPNKRFAGRFYLPRREPLPSMGEVVLAIDSSGSISDQELAEFKGHVLRIFSECRPRNVHLLFICDEVVFSQTFEQNEPIVFPQQNWCGSTDMRCAQEWALTHAPDADVVLILTDGYSPFPEKEEIPHVWVMTCNQKAPIGVNIYLERT